VKRTLLIDADIIAYQVAASNEDVSYFNGPEEPPAVTADLEGALADGEAKIADLKRTLAADDVIICLTDRGNEFRRDIWPEYKGNRSARKPELLFPVLDHFAAKYRSYLRPRLEADDCMGILSTHPSLVPGEKIIVSEDKDMQTVPGLLFNPRKDEEPRKVSKLSADRFHMEQTIVGDSTDNYPGAFRIGEKSPEVAAVRTSKSLEEAWGHVLSAFRRSLKGDPDEHAYEQAVTQARCARILRAADWDFKAKKPLLWQPPR
jgi:5'-3' exonuclease